MGASPLQLVVMLYDGAIKFVRQGQAAMEQGRLYDQNEALQRAQRIVVELLSSLDMARGGEVAKNLFGLYTFCYNELIASNVEDDPRKLDPVIKVLNDLRESWTELEKNLRNSATDVGGSHDISAAA